MADAYGVNLTTGAVTKNAVALANVLAVQIFIGVNLDPGVLEGPAPAPGFSIKVRIHDTAADARVLAQGPAGLLGGSVAAFAGKPAEYYLRSKTGDTLALAAVPATINANFLEGQSADGFAP